MPNTRTTRDYAALGPAEPPPHRDRGRPGHGPPGPPPTEEFSGYVAAGRQHPVHTGVGDQGFAEFTCHGVHQLKHVTGNTCLPQRFDDRSRASPGLR